jgi:predicted XRE-type DNA-binding protein
MFMFRAARTVEMSLVDQFHRERIGPESVAGLERNTHIIKSRGLTQVEAGAILGIKEPHVSALIRNRSDNFSVERLMDFSIALGQDVEITVRPTRKGHGQVSIRSCLNSTDRPAGMIVNGKCQKLKMRPYLPTFDSYLSTGTGSARLLSYFNAMFSNQFSLIPA